MHQMCVMHFEKNMRNRGILVLLVRSKSRVILAWCKKCLVLNVWIKTISLYLVPCKDAKTNSIFCVLQKAIVSYTLITKCLENVTKIPMVASGYDHC